MKIAGPVLVMMLPAADERHLSACAACQPRGDIAVVVQIDGGDLAGADDLGPVVLSYPDIYRGHACLLALSIAHGVVPLRRHCRDALRVKGRDPPAGQF